MWVGNGFIPLRHEAGALRLRNKGTRDLQWDLRPTTDRTFHHRQCATRVIPIAGYDFGNACILKLN